MKALMKRAGAPYGLELCEIEEPVCKDGDIKIEVKACGICATDLHIGQDKYPWDPGRPLGHEYSGVVVEKGYGVADFDIGDRVAGAGWGGFGKYLTINPSENNSHVYKIPDNMSYDEGAFIEPFSGGVRIAFFEVEIPKGCITLVSGPGCQGSSVMQALKAAGAVVVATGLAKDEERLEIAKQLGIDYTVNIEEEDHEQLIMELTGGKGADMVFECSGSQDAIHSGLKLVKRGGLYHQVGLPGKPVSIDMDSVVYRRITIMGQIGLRKDAMLKTIELISEGKINVKKLISHRLPLSEWRRGFEICEKGEGFKVLLIPD